jgi:flagellar protein FlaJ
MASVATAGVSRSELFEFAADLPYASSRYFKDIHILARKMNMDYAEACTVVAGRTSSDEVSGLLLRMAGSLSSGEHEIDFLRREAEVIGESYTNEYERDVEALKKWGDAYVTLLVASGMIVIVAVISMMIYQIGLILIIGLALLMVLATVLGSWILYISAPREIKTLVSGPSSRLQRLAHKLFNYGAPVAAVVSSLGILVGLDLGYVLILGGIIIFPAGYLIQRDDKNISRKDADIATVVRVLGGVTAAVGTTLTQALGTIDRRSMGAMMPEVNRLRQRLTSGITPDLCWRKMVDETGSELIDRTVEMFYKSISMGGEPGQVASTSAFYASKIAFLRAKRNMVAVTF